MVISNDCFLLHGMYLLGEMTGSKSEAKNMKAKT